MDRSGVLVRNPTVLAAIMLVVLAACGSDSADPPLPVDASWVQHVAPEPCRCADGSEFSFASRTVDPRRVVLYFEGGGACFSAETCSFTTGTYKVTADVERVVEGVASSGILNFDHPANPLAEWSFVFVPYCTGDVHLGNLVQDYGNGIEVHHVGFVNARHALDHLVERFPDAEEVLVTGSSAGGIPSPLFGGLVSDELPEAEVSVLADGSGLYPDNPTVNAGIGALWGVAETVPDWPVLEGLAPEEYSIPGLFTFAGMHDPDIRLARFDHAYDSIQGQFAELAQVSQSDQLEVLRANEAAIEDDGVTVDSYVAPGTDHTILLRPELYTLESDGVRFIDWFADYLSGDDVDDVTCTDCRRG